jgi:branched-subunit amino acid ABC-type transport system permease component
MNQIWLLIGAGVVDAALLAPAAVGLTMQFGITNYVNFAFGAFLTLSAFAFWELNAGPWFHLGLWEAGFLAAGVTSLASVCVGSVVYGPFFRRRPQLLFMLVLTFVISLMLDSGMAAIWGGRSEYQLSYPGDWDAPHNFGPIALSILDVAFIVISVASMAGTYAFLRFTLAGKIMRAISDDRALAQVCGLPIGRTTNITWLLTGFLAGIAGDILALNAHGFDTGLGDSFIYLVFAAVVFGGIGRSYGALVGAVVIGLVFQLSSLVVESALTPVAVFVVLVAVMMLRPNGLFGSTGRSAFAAS